MQDAVLAGGGVIELLFEEFLDLCAREIHDDQGVAERLHGVQVAEGGGVVGGGGVQVGPNPAGVHEGDDCALVLRGGQLRIGDQVAQRTFARVVVGPQDGGAGERTDGRAFHGVRELFGLGDQRGHLGVLCGAAGIHDDVSGADVQHLVLAAVDGHVEALQQVAVEVALDDGASVHDAVVPLVRVPADDGVHTRVKAVDDIGDGASQGAAGGFVEAVLADAALVNEHDDGVHALRLQLGDVFIYALGLVQEVQAGDPLGADDGGGGLGDRADEGDLRAVHGLDLVGGEHGFPGGLIHDVRAQPFEGRARVGVHELAGFAQVVAVAAAVLHALQFLEALVELVVAEAAELHAQFAEADGGGFVAQQAAGDG